MVKLLICCLLIIRKGWLFVSNFITWLAIFIMSCSEIFVWSIFYSEKINFKKFYVYLAIILMMCFGLINYFYINAFVRVVVVTFLMCFCNWIVFRKKFNEVILSTIYGQLILALSDLLCAIILIICGESVSLIKDNVFGTLIGNSLVSLIFVFLCSLKFIRLFYSVKCVTCRTIRF